MSEAIDGWLTIGNYNVYAWSLSGLETCIVVKADDLKVAFDMGYASDLQTWQNNALGNQLLWTLGAGVDIISFYDIVIRLEYSINKQNQTGFYLGLVAPI